MMKAFSTVPAISTLLEGHPRVSLDTTGSNSPLSFVNNRTRTIETCPSQAEVGGLVELMDNNPLVCANSAWLPTAAGQLSLIGLGPLIEAGLLVEPPAIILSYPDDEEGILDALETVNWHDGFTLQCENHDLGSVRGAYLLAKIKNPESWEDIDDIFDERYSRSFFVRRVEREDWAKELVEGKPWACYFLELTEGESESILAIHVMADVNGKLGSAGYIHMMNVMCGFEESLGLI
jgi:hypothetical protein